jgi:uncharacterized protein (DUF1800 family)
MRVAFSILLSCGLSFLHATVDTEIPVVTDGKLRLELPDVASTEQLQQLEWSTNLIDWEPVARDYRQEWENTYPHQVDISGDPQNQVFSRTIDGETRYFRVVKHPETTLPNRQAISRFLQQATFGPTMELIESFPGIDVAEGFHKAPYTYFEQWIDQQAEVPLFSLRKFFRERSNPAFVDNPTSRVPYEVGHNPELGHQLVYNAASIKYAPDPADALAAGRPENDVDFGNQRGKQIVWYQAAVTGEDVLRQRVAWALSQIFVLGEAGSNQPTVTERFVSYYDIFVRNAFGNYRDILEEVTYNPSMGYYLTYVDNKAFKVEGTYPDENYAREIMQLFTIGLWMLNPDGSLILDDNGEPIPTYDNDDIVEFAKIFTGMRKRAKRTNLDHLYTSNYIDPMYIQASWHDFSEKVLLDGSVIPEPGTKNQSNAKKEVGIFLDHLVDHPNTAPFVSKILIQRLTVSNPSPSYIQAVSEAFSTGLYNGNGTGVRGDMMAVVKAILLHPEARTPSLAFDDAHGKLREPIIRLLHYARAMNITSPHTYGFFPFDQLDEVFGQSPFESPTVFNFYQTDYQPLGHILDRGIYAPEFQINTDVTSLGLLNGIWTLIYQGIANSIGRRGYSQGDLDFTYEISIANEADALIDHLDLILTAGRLSPENRSTLMSVIGDMPNDTWWRRKQRVQRALYLFALLPEFHVIY